MSKAPLILPCDLRAVIRGTPVTTVTLTALLNGLGTISPPML